MRLVRDIWGSFRAMPLWVQLWLVLILVPMNMVSLMFVNQPGGLWVAVLANTAMLLNLPILVADRGFSKRMAFPHLPFWTVLVIWLILARPDASGAYGGYLWLLLAVDLISLGFDFPDAWRWWRGDRTVAGR